jgi:hypothetical protein
MRVIAPTLVALSFLISPLNAQDQSAQSGPQNPAMKSPDRNNAMSPVTGKNSFTQAQAQSKIQSKGYTNVSQLTLDSQGVWRGTASRDGKSVPVSIDYQGNVN